MKDTFEIIVARNVKYGANAPEYLKRRGDGEVQYSYILSTVDLILEVLRNKESTVIFLDKSARPVYWLFNELWHDVVSLLPGEASKTQKPHILFANIDKNNNPDIVSSSNFDSASIDTESEEYRRLVKKIQTTFGRSFKKQRRVRVVDEVRDTGATLLIARQLFQSAFPKSIFNISWWKKFATPTADGRVIENGEVPVWYHGNNENQYYTGIANKTDRTTFLSRPLSEIINPEKDKLGLSGQLRREMKKLANLFRVGEGKYSNLRDFIAETRL